MHKENTSPKLLTGKMKGQIIASFYKEESSKSDILEVHTIAKLKPGRHRGTQCGVGEQRPKSGQHGLMIPWVTLGETFLLHGLHLGEVLLPV